MAIAPGTRLGPYEITAQIGEGGMGEVYRAIDTSLGRQVAIKVLPDAVALDADRVARFEREARALAALNHVNIAAIHGIERSGGVPALVLELVEGPTLADRLVYSAIPVGEAITLATQIAEALEAAHEQGIIHRDLKPANIKVRHDGTVKVLDFGLAKLVQPDAAGGHPSSTVSPTVTSPALMTGAGVLLGTAAYMSPEQARGLEADKRSDVWAFGCVLFEMLSGKRPFAGDDVSETLASVLAREPDWTRLPPDVPPVLALFLRRCLQKDRRQRIADIHDVRLALGGAFEPPARATADAPRPRRMGLQRAVIAVAGAIAGAAIGVGAWRALEPAPSNAVTRSRFVLPPGQQFNTNFTRKLVAISPDGSQMAYSANNRLFVRLLSELPSRPVQGTESTQFVNPVSSPVFSPDGRSLAYHDGALKTISVAGGSAATIWPGDLPLGMTWSGDWIVFGLGPRGILRVAANGGTPEQLVTVKPGELAAHPQLLPGGVVLFTLVPSGREDGLDRWDAAQIVAHTLSTGDTKTLLPGADARYLPSGHLVFARGGTIFAAPFDVSRLVVTGGAVPVVEGVQRTAGVGDGSSHYGVSDTGTLVFAPGSARDTARRLIRMHRKGGTEPLPLPTAPYRSLRLSPDGSQVVYDIDTGQKGDLWVYRLAGDTPPRLLTLQGRNRLPIWSADGTRIIFQSDRGGDLGLYWQRADGTGTAERLTTAEEGAAHIPESSSPGDRLSYSVVSGARATLWTLSVRDGKASRLSGLESVLPFNSEISRDGRWIAYTLRSNRSANVYVEPLPPTGDRFPITTVNGHHPLWLPDGTGLSYRIGGGEQVVVAVKTRPTFTWGNPVPAIAANLPTVELSANRSYDITPDGATFVVVAIEADTQSGAVSSQEMHVVVNWVEELKRLAPVD